MVVSSPFIARQETAESANTRYYSIFLPGSDSSFFKQVKDGARDTANRIKCSISFHSIDSDPLSFEMASYSGVDGVAVYLYKDDDVLVNSLLKIAEAEIPIVQIENEVLNTQQSFFIGTNSFDSGKSIGRLAQSINEWNMNIALIYSDKNPGLISDSSLVELGIKSMLGNRIKKIISDKTSLNPLDADRLAYELMKLPFDLDLIVLTDPNDTLVTVRALIDMNLVGSVQIIGFGDNEAIREYIKKGIILGSIVRNPYQIGVNAVLALDEINKSGYTSAFVDTGVTIIDKNSDFSEPVEGNAQ